MGNITTAVRFANGDLRFRCDRDSTDVFAYPSIFEGDESGARAEMALPSRYEELSTIREDEYGVLVVDFQTKRILFNRTGQLIDRVTFFDPRRPFQHYLAQSGRVTLICPEGTFAPVKITGEMASSWEVWQKTIKAREPNYITGKYLEAPLPAWYFHRMEPAPEFIFDLSPWRLEVFKDTIEPENEESRLAFWIALEEMGFPVDRAGWMADFDDNFDDEDDAE
jgi:hypothetical protein